jgi:protein dithiol oxidoreductase (disulfide-forming)
MLLTRRDFNRYLLAGLAGVALPTSAAAAALEGRDYESIQPGQPGSTPGKIEVLEFFSYACPHCKDFHPLVMAWAAKLPADVSFKRVPVTFGRAAWANLARLYYSLEATGDLARLDDAVFRALQEQRVNLYTETNILDWVRTQRVDARRFAEAFKSFGVSTQVQRSDRLVKDYQVAGVPLLTVDGRYKVIGKAARSLADFLPIADQLIQSARTRRRP